MRYIARGIGRFLATVELCPLSEWVVPPLFRRLFANATMTVMARRPKPNKAEDVLSPEHLKQLGEHLSRLSPHAVLDFYQRAYGDCRIINSSTFPTARAVQELVQAWKQLRKWKK
jgi:hypothetical protein